jgi:hypothetical protein
MSQSSLESIVEQVRQLSPLDRVRLVEQVMEIVKVDVEERQPKKPRRSLYGVLAEFGPAPSAEEIDEVRREMWGNFPREDI